MAGVLKGAMSRSNCANLCAAVAPQKCSSRGTCATPRHTRSRQRGRASQTLHRCATEEGKMQALAIGRGTLARSLVLANSRLPRGALLIKIPEGGYHQTISKRDHLGPDPHYKRWSCSPVGVKTPDIRPSMTAPRAYIRRASSSPHALRWPTTVRTRELRG
jgi:hypothetical protein